MVGNIVTNPKLLEDTDNIFYLYLLIIIKDIIENVTVDYANHYKESTKI